MDAWTEKWADESKTQNVDIVMWKISADDTVHKIIVS